MEESHQKSADRVRGQLERGVQDGPSFRAALLDVPPSERDAWLDLVFGLGEPPDDGPELPRGCVPYLPCSVDAVLRMVEQVPIRATDVVVDVGSGLGRAAALVHLLSGAAVIGLEVQPRLVAASRDLAARLPASRMSCIEGDATMLTGFITIGSIFFLYCPFSGERLAKVLRDLELIARTRTIRVCSVDLPLPPCAWLTLESPPGDLAIYRSTLSDSTFAHALGTSA